MSKRSATSQPVDSPTAKRKAIEDSYHMGSPFNDSLVNSIEVYNRWNTNKILHHIRETVRELNDDDQGEPELTADLLRAEINVLNYLKKSDIHTLNNALTRFQAISKGAMTRNRVLPAMLSADPTDLRQAVQFCVNWEWGISNHQTY
jgi:hypothetical protein